MKGRLYLLAAAIAVGAIVAHLAGGQQTAGAAADPVACTGYPEPRIYLENQSWWEPQPGPPSHPGTGQVGHIHVGFCYPLYQVVTGPTLHLDVTVKLHNMPGLPSWLRAQSYGDVGWEKRIPGVDQNPAVYIPPCASADCEYALPWDIDLTAINYNGWHQFSVFLNVAQTDGATQRNWGRLYIDLQVPGKPQGTPGADAMFGTGASIYSDWAGGDTWYSNVDTGGKYAQADIARSSIPWDETTGALTPVDGTWTPTVRYEKAANFAYVDPAFHATPPSKGTIIYEATTAHTGYLTQTLQVDTTQLANGPHRLVIGSGNVAANGTNTGVLVIPFLVHNVVCS